MSEEMTPISVTILDKEYRVASPPEEQDSLVASAQYLDSKMREIRAGGKIIGLDRIAVMAALNIAHELLQAQHQGQHGNADLSGQIRRLQNKVENALQQVSQMDL